MARNFSVESWERQEERKRSNEKKKKRREIVSKNSRAPPPRSGDCDSAWTSSLRKGRTEVDNQVAAPTESSTPNLHRATIAQQRVRMEGWRQRRLGSMGTIWKKKNKEEERKRGKTTNKLAPPRPSPSRAATLNYFLRKAK